MHHFDYRDGELFCEDVPVRVIAEEVGTPFYLYSHATLSHHFRVFDGAFAEIPHLTCFAVKACSNLAVLHLFGSLGGGADIVSGGELFRALKAGIPAERIVYSGVGKTEAEMKYAVKSGILSFNVESEEELLTLDRVAGECGGRAPVSLRVNPDVDPRTHAYISTGLAKNKFGISTGPALELYRRAAELANIEIAGVSCHIGSQLTEIEPFVEALGKLRIFIESLAADGIAVRYLDIGGGLGIRYGDEEPPPPAEYAAAVAAGLEGLDCTLILEPGRVLTGNAGILVTRVLYTKDGPEKKFIIVDAGMNDLARPSLYDAFHAIDPVSGKDRPRVKADVVGPICETGDFLARDQMVPESAGGDLLAVMSAGAYGFSMSSNYNSRPRAAEVMVEKDGFKVIRRRETFADLIRGEAVP